MTSGWGTVYAWLKNSKPVPRRVGINDAGQKSKKRGQGNTGQHPVGERQVESSAQLSMEGEVSESGENDDTGDDTTHKRDGSGQAYAVQNTGTGGAGGQFGSNAWTYAAYVYSPRCSWSTNCPNMIP